MSRAGRDDRNLADLDELIEEITVDAYGDDEKLWAFRQALEDNVTLPSDGFVIGDAENHDQHRRDTDEPSRTRRQEPRRSGRAD